MSCRSAEPSCRSGIIEAFGGWSLFQDLRMALQAIAKRLGTTIDDIALRAIYDHADPAAIIPDVTKAHPFITWLQSATVVPTERDREALAAVLERREGRNGVLSGVERDLTGRKPAGSSVRLKVGHGYFCWQSGLQAMHG